MKWKVIVLAVLVVSCDKAQSLPTAPSSVTPSSPPVLTTFNLTGTVQDTVLRPIKDARVEIVDGPLVGQSTATDGTGAFAFVDLTPAAAIVTLRVTKQGYLPATTMGRNNAKAYAALIADALIDLSGEYQITFTAANSCGEIPGPLRRRSYAATIERSSIYGPGLVISLNAASLFPHYDSFSGTVAADAIRLFVFSRFAADIWLEDLPIIDRVDSSFVSFMGTALGPSTPGAATASLPFDGTIAYCPSAADPLRGDFPLQCAVPLIECRSNQHQVTLTRR